MNQDKAKHGTRHDTGPTVAVVVSDFRGSWNGGVFAGDPGLVAWAHDMATSGALVHVFDTDLTCDSKTPLGALASMASYSPGRCLVVDAPDEVLAEIGRQEVLPDPWSSLEVQGIVTEEQDALDRAAAEAR